ncbi:7554_t:CDS:2, partial [Gigaspora margarita]
MQADKNSKTNSSVLDKILDEMGDENHAIAWKNINTRLESIFGCDEILNIPEETQKSKYLEWIISLQNWAFADKYPIKLWKEKAKNTFASIIQRARDCEKEIETSKKNVDNKKREKLLTANNDLVHNNDENPADNDEDQTDDDDEQADIEAEYVHIDFGNELGSVEEGLKTWSSIDNNIENVYAEVKLQRFCHFLKLYDAYVVLFQLAIKEPSSSNQKISIKQKKDSGIPLGITAPFRSIRGWVGYRMKSFLQIKSRGERRFWIAICRIRFILNENLTTVKQLVNSGASPHFFQLLSDEDFNNFLILIANEKPVNFNSPIKSTTFWIDK